MSHNFSLSHKLCILLLSILVPGNTAASIMPANLNTDFGNLCIEGTQGNFFDLRCTFLRNSNALKNILDNLNEHAFILELNHLDWKSFPLNFFHNVSLHTLIIANSTFSAFQNRSTPDYSVESLLHFSLENVTLHEKLQWEDFKALKKLEILSIYNTTISSTINSSFGHNLGQTLTVLTIAESNVTEIKSDGFRPLKNLTYLRISHNKLETFPKLILKSPEKLEQLRLDYNRINTLPAGVFDNFSNLKVLSLSNNSLSTLREEVFSVLWRPSVRIELRDNPIKCDCRIHWIVSSLSKPRRLIGKCAHPKRLYGRNLIDLKAEDFSC